MTIGALPDGAFIELGDEDYRVLWRGALHRWTPGGYVDPSAAEVVSGDEAIVLTPGPSLAALRHGYPVRMRPSIHDA